MEYSMDQVLEAFMEKENSTRRAAEQYYFSVLEQANGAAVISTELLRLWSDASVRDRVRYMALVMFRRLVDHTKPVWGGLVETVDGLEEQVKTALLDAFTHDSKQMLKHLLAHCIAEVAVSSAGKGCSKWPELLTTVFSLTQSETVEAKLSALFLFDKLAEYGGNKLLSAHVEHLRPVLEGLLQNDDNEVRVAAMEATSRFIVSLHDDSLRRTFQSLVPIMLTIMEAALLENELSAKAALNGFTDILAEDPTFMKPYIEQACNTMITITGHDGFESSTRRLGLEFMICLAEEAGGTLRKMKQFVAATLQMALDFLCLVSEDAGWSTKGDDEYTFIGDEAEGENADLVTSACAGMDRLAQGVGGKTLWPVLSEIMAPMLASGDWKARRAAILVVGLVGEGCKKYLAPMIRTVIEGIVPFVSDAHPRVRHAAIRTLGQLLRDFSDPTTHESMDGGLDIASGVVVKAAAVRGKGREKLKSIQDAAADLITPALINALKDNADQPRVQACATLAMINLVSDGFCERKHLLNMEREMLGALFQVVQDSPLKSAKQSSLVCVGLVAGILAEDFVEYYPIFIPICRQTLANFPGKEHIKLRGDALHSFSLIAEAVGREVAGMDAAEMVNFILLALKNKEYEDSEAYEYMIMALARLASCLGADFGPYFEFALPLLYEVADMEVGVVAIEDEQVDDDDERVKGKIVTSVTLPGMAPRSVAIDSQALSMKLGALSVLVTLVEELGVDCPAFWPHVPNVAKSIVGNFLGPFASIREVALGGTQYLMLAALADVEHPETAQQVFNFILENLFVMLDGEKQLEVVFVIAEAFCILLKLGWDSYAATMAKSLPETVVPFGSPVDGQTACVRMLAETLAPTDATPHAQVIIQDEFLERICDAAHAFLESSYERRKEVVASAARHEDADEEDVEKLRQALEPEDDLISSSVDMVGYCVKMHGAKMFPIISKDLGPYMLPFLSSTEMFMEPLRSAAVCICDDLIEFASPDSHVLLDALTPSLLTGIESDDAFVRHSAAYGLGICAMHAGPAFDAAVPEAVNKLTHALVREDAKEYENGSATDNAVAALLKIAGYRRQLVDTDLIVAGALAFFPLKYDSIEGRYMHGALIEGLASGDTFWLGSDFSRAPTCLAALASALVAHKANMTEEEAGDDDDEDDDGDTEPLISQRHLDALPAIFESLKSSPMSGAVAAVVSGMKKKQKAVLAEFGLAF